MEPLRSLELQGKQSRTIRLSVNPQADFREVIRTLETIAIPPISASIEHVRFAILELLNNSLRAHRERGEQRQVNVDLTMTDGRLVIAIRDFGGGFDPKRLPYDLDADPATLDVHSPSFQAYQKINGYKRFGMGIYIAKKTFDDFRLVFLDDRDRPGPWVQGRIAGTLITLTARGTRAPTGDTAVGGREAANGH